MLTVNGAAAIRPTWVVSYLGLIGFHPRQLIECLKGVELPRKGLGLLLLVTLC